MNPDNNSNGNQTNQALGNRPKKEKTKKVQQRVALKPEQFQSKKGIRSLYQKTKQLNLDDHSEINVQNTLKKITVLLKSWHFQLLPKYSFDLFLQRCQALGSHKLVSAHMARVRRIHKGLDTWPEIVQEQEQNHQRKPEEEQEMYNGRMQEENQQEMKMLNSFNSQTHVQKYYASFENEDQEDEDLVRLMNQVEKKKTKNNNYQSQPQQPYVPEGFQPEFQDNQSD